MTDVESFPRLLNLLGRGGNDDLIRLAHDAGGAFKTAPVPLTQIPAALQALTGRGNVWFELNPSAFSRPLGRSNASDVTALVALYADIDFKTKPHGMGSLPEALDLLADLEGALGVPASAIVYSGHGIQPYWPMTGVTVTDENRNDIAQTLKRFGTLATQFATAHGGAIDNVFDLPRILRVPGPANLKDSANPVATSVSFPATPDPIDLAWLNQVLDDYEIPVVEIVEVGADIVSSMGEWEWAEEDCAFAAIAGREIETSSPASRHHWALKWAAILHGMVRDGCLTERGFYGLRAALVQRFEYLLASEGTPRKAGANELNSIFRTGRLKAETWSTLKLAEELRQHTHKMDFGLANDPPVSDDTPGAVSNVSSIFTRQPVPATATGPVLTVGALALDTEMHSQRRMLQASFTDLSNSEKLAHHLRGSYVWVPTLGWHEWDGGRYTPDQGNRVQEATKDMFVQMMAGAPDDAHRKWAHQSLSKAKMNAALDLSKSVPFLVVNPVSLDANPYEVNTPAGIVDLRHATLRPADPMRDYHTLSTGIAPAHTPIPRFMQFLIWAIGDVERINYLQRLFGAAMIGELRWRIFPIFLGVGGNGKSTLLEIMAAVFGQYATVMPRKFLIEKSGNEHPTEIAQLRGIRLAVVNEVPPTARFDEDLVKNLTGDSYLRARFMGKDFFTFKNTATPFLAANHLPAVRIGGPGFWSRVRKIDFENAMPLAKQTLGLAASIVSEEGAGILQWVIDGAREALDHDLQDPSKVLTATRQYQLEEDTMARFMEDTLVAVDGVEVSRKAVYDIYKEWTFRQKYEPLPYIKFVREITMIRPDTNIGTRDYFTNTSMVRYQVDYAPEEA